jgi:nucleoside-diphosphate-sugar epimerase
MKSVFVTGVNGLLGTNLVHLLLNRGYLVKGLIREKSRYKGKVSPNLQWVVGDLFDDYTKELLDVDYAVHCAAIICQKKLCYNDYYKANVNATVQLFQAAASCKVKRFIFVSTANTVGYGSFDKPGHENVPIREPFSYSFYARSKKEAEDYLISHNHRMETIIVNPTFMLGPYDTMPSSGRIILLGWRRKVIFYPPGGKNFVHVEDVAEGIIKCLESGRAGDKYILSGENLSYLDFFRKLNAVATQNPVMIKIPAFILRGAGLFGEFIRGIGIKSYLSLVNMKILCVNNYYSNQKSVSELGMRYRSIDLAIADAINYLSKVKSQQ